MVSLDGVLPTAETIKDGTYPMARRLYMATYGDPSPIAMAFLDFVLSPAGQGIAQKNGFIPEGPVTPADAASESARAKTQPDFGAALAAVGLLAVSYISIRK